MPFPCLEFPSCSIAELNSGVSRQLPAGGSVNSQDSHGPILVLSQQVTHTVMASSAQLPDSAMTQWRTGKANNTQSTRSTTSTQEGGKKQAHGDASMRSGWMVIMPLWPNWKYPTLESPLQCFDCVLWNSQLGSGRFPPTFPTCGHATSHFNLLP